MIQRIQSVWLLLAALFSACILFTDLYHYQTLLDGATVTSALKVNNHYLSLVLVILITLLPLVSIFMFRQRKKQIGMAWAAIVAAGGFIALSLWRVSELGKLVPPPTSGNYWIGSVLPVISIVMLFLAISGINRDEKLVQSMDRLR